MDTVKNRINNVNFVEGDKQAYPIMSIKIVNF